ncbi:sulfurtransferase TusA family protein [Thiohalorhabdus methylotrophus]|uniref:Sulfurtransferase TusA family protein n=1 Tax=Thiohalorhabdus methylotrophus TaxID=3242694 RepID=A0ABV4TXI7_9GAMM
MNTHLVDVRNTSCPTHIKFLVAKLRELAPGETVELLTGDPTVLDDVRTWLQRTGHEFLGSTRGEEGIRIFVAKKQDPQSQPAS